MFLIKVSLDPSNLYSFKSFFKLKFSTFLSLLCYKSFMERSTFLIPEKFNSDIELVNTEFLKNGLIYIYVNFISKVSPKDRGTLLLDLEDELVKKDERVRVWHIPLGDKNSLRNLRGIKIKNP